MSVHVLGPLFSLDWLCWVVRLTYSRYKFFMICKNSFPLGGLSFYFLDGTLWSTFLILSMSKLSILFLIACALRGTSHVALVVKNPLANAGDFRDMGLIPGSGRSPEEGTATHSSVLAWRIPWTEVTVHGVIKSQRQLKPFSATHSGLWVFGFSLSSNKTLFKQAGSSERVTGSKARGPQAARRNKLQVADIFPSIHKIKECPTLWDPMDCSPPGSSVHGTFQARILEWFVISFSRGSSQPRDQTWVSWTAGRFFTNWATREALMAF